MACEIYRNKELYGLERLLMGKTQNADGEAESAGMIDHISKYRSRQARLAGRIYNLERAT